MPVKEHEKTETRTVSTRRATAGAPQRMHKVHPLDEAVTPAPTVSELEERQRRKGSKRRPTRSYEGAAPTDADEDSVPDVPPTSCD